MNDGIRVGTESCPPYRPRLVSAFIIFSCFAWNAAAEYTPQYAKAHAAIKAAFPDREFSIWTSAEGDLNGDGIPDLALVITASKAESSRDERLVVLLGHPDQNYSLLSASDEYCHVRYHYHLSIEKNSLFAQGFSKTAGDAESSFTLQFRYNSKVKDLEIIGTENFYAEYESNSSYKVSVNYLSNLAIHSRRAGKRLKEIREKITRMPLAKLQGFNCLAYAFDDHHTYIREDFSVKK